MSADGARFEYPDEAGYPDGMGVLHEGTEDASGAAADAAEAELDDFAMQDEEDLDEGV
jgi:hypothetical protein